MTQRIAGGGRKGVNSWREVIYSPKRQQHPEDDDGEATQSDPIFHPYSVNRSFQLCCSIMASHNFTNPPSWPHRKRREYTNEATISCIIRDGNGAAIRDDEE